MKPQFPDLYFDTLVSNRFTWEPSMENHHTYYVWIEPDPQVGDPDNEWFTVLSNRELMAWIRLHRSYGYLPCVTLHYRSE